MENVCCNAVAVIVSTLGDYEHKRICDSFMVGGEPLWAFYAKLNTCRIATASKKWLREMIPEGGGMRHVSEFMGLLFDPDALVSDGFMFPSSCAFGRTVEDRQYLTVGVSR